MLKKCLILASVCSGITSSSQAVFLNEEDIQDLKTLYRLTPAVKRAWDKAKSQVKKDYNQEAKLWFHPSGEKCLKQLAELHATPESQWPIDIFPKSLLLQDNTTSMAQHLVEQAEVVKETPKFTNEFIFPFIGELKKRKAIGTGLRFRNPAHLVKCTTSLDDLGQTQMELHLIIDTSKKITQRFSENLYKNFKILKKTEQDDFSMDESQITSAFKDQYIKDKIFFDAASYLYESTLNLYGNLLWLNALIYKDVGDTSLETKFLELSIKDE